jgi:hypothetical protein
MLHRAGLIRRYGRDDPGFRLPDGGGLCLVHSDQSDRWRGGRGEKGGRYFRRAHGHGRRQGAQVLPQDLAEPDRQSGWRRAARRGPISGCSGLLRHNCSRGRRDRGLRFRFCGQGVVVFRSDGTIQDLRRSDPAGLRRILLRHARLLGIGGGGCRVGRRRAAFRLIDQWLRERHRGGRVGLVRYRSCGLGGGREQGRIGKPVACRRLRCRRRDGRDARHGRIAQGGRYWPHQPVPHWRREADVPREPPIRGGEMAQRRRASGSGRQQENPYSRVSPGAGFGGTGGRRPQRVHGLLCPGGRSRPGRERGCCPWRRFPGGLSHVRRWIGGLRGSLRLRRLRRGDIGPHCVGGGGCPGRQRPRSRRYGHCLGLGHAIRQLGRRQECLARQLHPGPVARVQGRLGGKGGIEQDGQAPQILSGQGPVNDRKLRARRRGERAILPPEARRGLRHLIREQVEQRDAIGRVKQGEPDHRSPIGGLGVQPAARQDLAAPGLQERVEDRLRRWDGGQHGFRRNRRVLKKAVRFPPSAEPEQEDSGFPANPGAKEAGHDPGRPSRGESGTMLRLSKQRASRRRTYRCGEDFSLG